MSELDKTKRPAVCDAWDAYRKQPELLEKIEQLDQANKLLADKFNQAIAQRDTWTEKSADYMNQALNLNRRLAEIQKRSWWQRLLNA